MESADMVADLTELEANLTFELHEFALWGRRWSNAVALAEDKLALEPDHQVTAFNLSRYRWMLKRTIERRDEVGRELAQVEARIQALRPVVPKTKKLEAETGRKEI